MVTQKVTMNGSWNREFTADGNPKSALLDDIIGWFVKACNKESHKVILNSFKVCGLTKMDRSEDEQIILFQEGKCCTCKLDEFRKWLETATNDENAFLNSSSRWKRTNRWQHW